jgi:phenylacetate-CoA ligase
MRLMAAAPPPFDAWLWMQSWQETWLASQWPATARALRAQRLAALLHDARSDSPLYQRRLAGSTAFDSIAPVDKTELVHHFDDWATDRRITRTALEAFVARDDNLADGLFGRYLVWTSSGTTGAPCWFVQDARSLAAYDALDALRLRGAATGQPSLGVWGRKECFAFVGATGGHYAGVVSMQRLRRIVPAALLPAIHLLSVLQPLREVAEQLMRCRPTVLITYPSAADALAQMQREGALDLKLREVWVGGEQLSPSQRADIAAAFGCPVRNNYGASECFSIAWECGHGRLHLNEDWVIAEPVDERSRPVPPGELSHNVLITNLANRTQPIIRYRLDDRVRVLAERCSCGSAFAAIEVQGRSGNTLQVPGRQHTSSVTILPLALETAIEEGAGVAAFQVIAHPGRARMTLELRFSPTVTEPHAAFERCRVAIDDYLRTQGCRPTLCRYSPRPPACDANSGKVRRIVKATAARD